MKCPKCGAGVPITRTLEGVLTDLSNHVSNMTAHLRVIAEASPANPVDRSYELAQVEAAARAQVLIVRALNIVVGAFEEGLPPGMEPESNHTDRG